MHPKPEPPVDLMDVVICGGSLAGAATALLLLRARPELRVAVVEKSVNFSRRVGEATVEVSGFFLSKVLGLAQHLNECHLNKQGMRFWFQNSDSRSLADASEIGGRYLARVPAWQVDRSVLDEEVLRRATEAGAKLFRPAKAVRATLNAGGVQTVTIEESTGKREIRTRWVVDASGFTAILARQEGFFRRNQAHPTTAVWARWRGVKDWDGRELADRFPEWFQACRGIRATATNHLMGHGWWSWWIPLKGGDTSVGVVFDQRLVKWPGTGDLAGRLKGFLMDQHPVARELFASAVPVQGDVSWRSNLAYSSTTFAGDGFVLTGDSAAFIDPLYSPGMDWLSYTSTRAVSLILAERGGETGEALKKRVEKHNNDFRRSYCRWFDAVYRDKYEYLGDFELMAIAFDLDLAMYYIGVVSQPMKFGPKALLEPVFMTRPSEIPFYLMRAYNRRLVQMARSRLARGTYGRHNSRRRFLLQGYRPDPSCFWPVLRGFRRWLSLELVEGWRTWFLKSGSPAVAPKAQRAAG